MHIYEDPDWFLTSFDIPLQQVTFLRTEHSLMRNAAFHDGRTPLSANAETRTSPLADALAWQRAHDSNYTPLRIIAHMSFCGSTLLSKLLERHCQASVYREPQALVDIADLRASKHPYTEQSLDWNKFLVFVFEQYQKPARQKLSGIAKPSNWANTILPDLLALRPDAKLIMIDLDLRDYLLANIRGGRGRIAYSLNLLNHLSRYSRGHYKNVDHVNRNYANTLQRILRLLTICYVVQTRLFTDIRSHLQAGQILQMSKVDLMQDTLACLKASAQYFDLNPPQHGSKITEDLHRNAKSDGAEPYTITRELGENAQLEAELGQDLDETERWHAAAFSAG